MGILNATPDSFSDGGAYLGLDAAVRHAWRMVEEGADIIDVGGESTRPGARAVSEEEEIERVVPIIRTLVRELPVPISIDTSKAGVMRAAASAGVGMINDVRALREPGSLDAARDAAVPVCLMHMQGEPRSMQDNPYYRDVVAEVHAFLSQRVEACAATGIGREQLLLDPGFGFGKTLAHNIELFRSLRRFVDIGAPLLVGISRKRMIGALLGDAAVERRLNGSLAAAVLAVAQGASVVRVHDVAPTVEALRVAFALMPAHGP
jgi:dihydropteroate synthase